MFDVRLLADRCQACIRRIAVVIILHAAEHGIQRFIGIKGNFTAYALPKIVPPSLLVLKLAVNSESLGVFFSDDPEDLPGS